MTKMDAMEAARFTAFYVYAIFVILFLAAVFQIASIVGGSIVSTTHVRGHECIVMRTGFERSISCDWTKP